MPLIDGVPLDNPGMRWAHRATSEPLPSYDADLSDLKRTGRDGVVSLAGTTSPVVLRIVVQTPRENLESLIALFRQGKIWSNGGRETPFEFKSISPTGFGPADQVIDATFVIRLPGAFMRAKDPETTTLALIGTSHTLSCFAARPVGVLSLDRNLLTNPSFETGSGTAVVRTNQNPNPRLASSTTGWATTSPTMTMTATAAGAQIDVVTGPTSVPLMFNNADFPAVVGDVWSASMEVTVPTGFPAAPVQLRCYAYGTGAVIADSGVVAVQPGTTVTITANSSAAVAASATGVRTILYGAATPTGARLVVRNALAEKRPAAGAYFDGATQPVVRTNLATRPQAASVTGAWQTNNGTLYPRTYDAAAGRRPGSGAMVFTRQATSPSSALASAYAGGNESWGVAGRVAVTAGQQVVVSAYSKSSVAFGTAIAVRCFDASNATIGTDISGAGVNGVAGEWVRPFVTFTVPAGVTNIGIANQSINLQTGVTSGGELAWMTDAQYEVGTTPTPFFDGSGAGVPLGFSAAFTGTVGASPSILWDADLSTRWTSAANASTSELFGVGVAGISTSNAVAVQSSRWTKAGAKSMRIIPTHPTATAYAEISPAPLGSLGVWTAIATYHLEAPLNPAPSGIRTRTLGVGFATAGNFHSNTAPNVAGDAEVRVTATTSGRLIFFHDGVLGSGDMWVDLATLTTGTYSGPAFTGSTAPPDRLTLFGWDGLPDQSPSTRTVYASWDGGLSAPVQDAVIRVKGAATGIQVTDSSGAWAILPDVPAGQWIRFETDTGRAYQTSTDTWTGGTEVSGLVDFGGPRGVFEITPVMAPGDPGSRSGQVTVTTASRTGAVIEVRGKAAYLL